MSVRVITVVHKGHRATIRMGLSDVSAWTRSNKLYTMACVLVSAFVMPAIQYIHVSTFFSLTHTQTITFHYLFVMFY